MSRKPERQKFTVSPSICVKRANCGKRANCVGQAVCRKRANCGKRADCEKGGAKSLRDKISMHSASKNAIWIYLLYLNVHHSINKQRNMRSKNTVETLLFAFGFKKKEWTNGRVNGKILFYSNEQKKKLTTKSSIPYESVSFTICMAMSLYAQK